MPPSDDAREPMLAASNSIRIDPTRTRRRKKQQSEGYSNGNILGRFSRWDQYKQSSASGGGDATARTNLGSGLGRRVSVRRTDFTNRKELEHFSKQKRFIFHRGFFRRNAGRGSIKYRDNRLRLKNSAELNAALQYIDLPTLDPEEVITTKEVVMFKPEHLRQRTPAVVISSVTPLETYAKGLHRRASIKRPLPSSNTPSEVKLTRTTAPALPKRSLTAPASIKSYRQRSYSPHTLRIKELWKEYLFLVIRQRLQLRVSLLGDPDENTGSRDITRVLNVLETKESLHTTNYPFASAAAAAVGRDDVDEASISLLLAAKRKAF